MKSLSNNNMREYTQNCLKYFQTFIFKIRGIPQFSNNWLQSMHRQTDRQYRYLMDYFSSHRSAIYWSVFQMKTPIDLEFSENKLL